MYISKVTIKNYRIFKSDKEYEINDFNVPDGQNNGKGITIIAGENGSGKTTILDAISSAMIEYKADSYNAKDINNLNEKTEIKVFSDVPFKVQGTFPNTEYEFKGISFIGGVRGRGNRSFLQSMSVHDQIFLKVNPDKPKDGSPDLRLSVNNPFSGKRFNDTDVVYLDKNRLFQIKSGTYNETKFDRLMEDFNYQYYKNTDTIEDLNVYLNENVKKGKIENDFLADAIKKFEEISDYKVQLDFINNYQPFDNARFVTREDNKQILLSGIGSGYEMIFSLLYSYYLSKQNGKKMIILIDEPELHLHPKIQEKFIDFLIDISKDVQVIATTHSPIIIKQLLQNEFVKIIIVKKDCSYSEIGEKKLSYNSANEINYLAFDFPTEEYHNELYEKLKNQYGSNKSIKDFDKDFFISTKGETKSYPWKGNVNEVSLHTFVRNQIHHQAENGKATVVNLEKSITDMRSYL
ncbi:MAG: AAA family ATPase [Clostridia bacterium]|nr:AAA family ATPase [Clostridia bacterium]